MKGEINMPTISQLLRGIRKPKLNKNKEEEVKEKLYTLMDVVDFPYGTKFENTETGTIYIMEQQLKILKSNGDYDYPALDKDSFLELYRKIN